MVYEIGTKLDNIIECKTGPGHVDKIHYYCYSRFIFSQVRKAFLKAIGCHEAARRQETVQNMRRSSAAYIRRRSSAGLVPPPKGFQAKGPLPSNLKFTNNFQFTLKKNKRKNFDMESCYDTDTVSETTCITASMMK